MKTQNQTNTVGLPVRPSTPVPEQTTTTRPNIDLHQRAANRALPTAQVLDLLRSEAPQFFTRAEIVGKWVWIQFPDKQPREVTSTLAQLGFHWNNARQIWQHPCGHLTAGSPDDPRSKYGTIHAADYQRS